MDLALFDFDGTVTTRDTMPDFVRQALPKWRLRAGSALLLPMIFGYRAGRVSGTTLRAAIAQVGFAGLAADDVAVDGQRFAFTVLPALVRPAAMARIDWHRARGDAVVIVSGGLDAYLGPWAAAHGLPLLCSSLERRGRRLTGRFAGAQCVLEEKCRRVRTAYDVGAFDRVHAYGDSVEDAPMLAMADVAHFRSMPSPPAAHAVSTA